MKKRDVIYKVLHHEKPPYTPWSFKFTVEPLRLLKEYYSVEDLDNVMDNHILNLGSDIGFFEEIEKNQFQDVFGVVWDRTIDKDIGNPTIPIITEPNHKAYDLPNPLDPRFFEDIEEMISCKPDMFRVFQIGFSLFERAWAMRGMENLLMDFYLNPDFVHRLLDNIADYNIEQLKEACKYDIYSGLDCFIPFSLR